MPRDSNQRAVPAIFPPPMMWLIPWARKTPARTIRATKSAKFTEDGLTSAQDQVRHVRTSLAVGFIWPDAA